MSAFDTLFSTIQEAPQTQDGARLCFINAQAGSAPHIDFSALELFQYFRPDVDRLAQHGFDVCADYTQVKRHVYDQAYVLLPQNIIAARYHVALGLLCLKEGGRIYVAADNKAGGTRIAKMLQNFGVTDVVSESRNKARCCTAVVHELDHDAISQAISEAQPHKILEDRYLSQAGIFGWDKVDKGSQILAQLLPPKELKGMGADFGCGYGYLSDVVLRTCPKVKGIHAIDADARALEMCKTNLEHFEQEKMYHWHDLTQPLQALRNLDFIVMNPPFHEGKKQDIEIGNAFIHSAHAALHKFGRLWIVANAHLAYENTLEKTFFTVDKHHEGQGFKVFEAVK